MVLKNIEKGIHTGLGCLAYTAANAEPLEKAVKLVERVIRIAEVIGKGLSAAANNLGSQLKNCIIVFETLKFVGIMNYLVNPQNGKYFLTNPANSWQKRVDRVTLAFHCAFKTVKGLNKFGLVELGVMAKNAIGKLPIFVLLMDSFILASSFFSSWDSIANGLPQAQGNIAKADKQLDKWQYRPTAITLLKAGDLTEWQDYYTGKLTDLRSTIEKCEKEVRLNEDKLQKIDALQKEPGSAKPSQANQEKMIAKYIEENKKHTLIIKKAQTKLDKTESRFQKLASGEFKELAEELEKTDANWKIRKWEAEKFNAKLERSKVWIRIANAIGKIAVVTLALTLTAMNLWAAPFMLSLLFLGILVDSIGLTKILTEQFWEKKLIPSKPISARPAVLA